MSDQELRDLLHRVVPEPPTPDPRGPVALARRWRARRRTGAVVGVAAVVAGVLVTVSVIMPRDETVAPAPAVGVPSLTSEPYHANTCPPADERTSTREVELDDVVAIVRCGPPYVDSARTVPFTPDAYVDDMGAFARLVETTSGLPLDCRLLSSTVGGTLVFRHADGTADTVDQDQCETVRVEGTPVLVRVLHGVFDEALGRQRDRLDYAPRATAPTCDDPAPSGPVEPGRETFVAAVVCSLRGSEIHRLDPHEVAALQTAWAAAEPLPPGQPDSCASLLEDYSVVLGATDHGDVVEITRASCGDYLVRGDLAIRVSSANLGLR